MVFDLIIKFIEEVAERQRRSADEVRKRIAAQRAAAMPAAAPVEGARKKKKKKKHHAQEAVPFALPVVARRAPEPALDDLPVWTEADSSRLEGRDFARLFVLGEILAPPLALREEE